MARKYMFNDADDMIDLARDIQINVYWGGYYTLINEYCNKYPWKNFWDNLAHERVGSIPAVGVSIDSNNVRFLYGGDKE